MDDRIRPLLEAAIEIEERKLEIATDPEWRDLHEERIKQLRKDLELFPNPPPPNATRLSEEEAK